MAIILNAVIDIEKPISCRSRVIALLLLSKLGSMASVGKSKRRHCSTKSGIGDTAALAAVLTKLVRTINSPTRCFSI